MLYFMMQYWVQSENTLRLNSPFLIGDGADTGFQM